MTPLSFGRWLGFAVAWLGMQPRLFAATDKGPLPRSGELMRRGLIHAASGAVLIGLARLTWIETGSRGWLRSSASGLSLAVHFGLCNLLAGLETPGVRCDALFRAPLRSQNLGEFWAKRWNLAFSEMTAIAVYRPLAARVGRGPALLAGFALSGLLHEMAISVPVRAGIGLPLLYFLMREMAFGQDASFSRAGHPLAGWTGRAWAFFWIVMPLPILFHQPFLAGIIWPLIGVAR
jgi:alginate O-acetyltransferase complex protein AlgI